MIITGASGFNAEPDEMDAYSFLDRVANWCYQLFLLFRTGPTAQTYIKKATRAPFLGFD
jgi:hypothetical protein